MVQPDDGRRSDGNMLVNINIRSNIFYGCSFLVCYIHVNFPQCTDTEHINIFKYFGLTVINRNYSNE